MRVQRGNSRRPGSWKDWLPPILLMAVIFALSSVEDFGPGNALAGLEFMPPLMHVLLYGALATLVRRALRSGGMAPGGASISAMLIAVGYGITDEIHQAFVPGRDASALDLLADAGGAAAAMALTSWWSARRRRRRGV